MRLTLRPVHAVVLFASLALCGCATRPANDDADQAEVRKVTGIVEAQFPGTKAWRSVFAGETLPVGSSVRTPANSTALLRLGRNGPIVQVQPRSRLTIVRLSNRPDGSTDTLLDLHEGKTFVDDETVKAGSRVEIRTPTGIITTPPEH